MAYSANGNNFTSKSLSRVRYDLEIDSSPVWVIESGFWVDGGLNAWVDSETWTD